MISQLPYMIQNQVNNLLSNGVVTMDIVVGSIFLARGELLEWNSWR